VDLQKKTKPSDTVQDDESKNVETISTTRVTAAKAPLPPAKDHWKKVAEVVKISDREQALAEAKLKKKQALTRSENVESKQEAKATPKPKGSKAELPEVDEDDICSSASSDSSSESSDEEDDEAAFERAAGIQENDHIASEKEASSGEEESNDDEEEETASLDQSNIITGKRRRNVVDYSSAAAAAVAGVSAAGDDDEDDEDEDENENCDENNHESNREEQTQNQRQKDLMAKVLTVWKGDSSEEEEEGDERYTRVQSIPSWQSVNSSKKVAKPGLTFEHNSEHNQIVKLWKGDMTCLKIDAICNAANSGLYAGGGICGAIHRAAGPKLARECNKLGGCPTGKTKITQAYSLPCKYVLHTVGPTNPSDSKSLVGCYNSMLDLCLEHELTGVCFCCVATGIYGFPNLKAAHIALGTTRRWLDAHPSHPLKHIVFCTFAPKDTDIYHDLIHSYFPK